MTATARLPRSIRNPYRVPLPAVISFSGGRTSGFMLKNDRRRLWTVGYPIRCLRNLREHRPSNVPRLWNSWTCAADSVVQYEIHWVEYLTGTRRTAPASVDFATASRNGEPYAALIDRKGFVPKRHD